MGCCKGFASGAQVQPVRVRFQRIEDFAPAAVRKAVDER